MRIDKYLKVTRLIKRRTVAKELLNRDIFTINGKVAKPSTPVKQGDILTLLLGRHKLIVEVIKTERTSKKEDVQELYKILSEEIIKDDRD